MSKEVGAGGRFGIFLDSGFKFANEIGQVRKFSKLQVQMNC